MPLFPSFASSTKVSEVMRARPHKYAAWPQIAAGVMRAPSALSPAERELIAAFVSGLNACHYCLGAHLAAAEAFGVETKLLEKLLENVDSAPVEGRLKPLFHYVKKLTVTPSRMVQADADAVFAAGWDEDGLHDAIAVCCFFSFMNRMVEGHGIDLGDAGLRALGIRLKTHGYPGTADD